MRNKKAQLTLFVIVALVIVVLGLVSYFLYRDYQKTKQEKIEREISLLRIYFDEKTKEITTRNLVIIGLQGGYYTLPEERIELGMDKIPYYYYNKKKFIPTIKEIENQLENQIEKEIKGLKPTSKNVKIILTETEVNAKISETIVEFFITAFFSISVNRKTSTIREQKEIKYEVPIPVFLEIAKNLTEIEGPYVDVELIFHLQERYNLTITPIFVDNTILYTIQDKKFLDGYSFRFAIQNG